ncbi:hypothetical protein F0L74_19990 [Chitinophaga agrisoli]|uniref:Uncharacterized protein n=1 Tax=Chitinophaga agrisoli TaxID=2607653 RepID=A0A5B2VJW5_9BACT|nr:hypothetical protein [Chitinophaga agrisoli]KAA2238507.1 hypothetical protein F0L74_19990 [Chitinophaga agrisoli]
MATINLFSSGIFLHITGIALLAGGTVGSFVTLRQLWKYLPADQQKATVVFKITAAYSLFFRIGGALMLISGFMLLRAFQFAVSKQSWFEIKMGLIVLMILNITLLGAPGTKRLGVLLESPTADMLQLSSAKRRMDLFYILQVAILLLIFVLGVFKFQ